MGTLYVSRSDFLSKWQHAENFSSVDVSAVDEALANASSTVDSYLRKRYGLPLVTFGSDVRDAVAALAAYQLLTDRGFNPESAADKAIRTRYLDKVEWLEKVREGHVEIEGDEISKAAPIVVSQDVTSRSRLFTRNRC
jgi:phage gp36-like protein